LGRLSRLGTAAAGVALVFAGAGLGLTDLETALHTQRATQASGQAAGGYKIPNPGRLAPLVESVEPSGDNVPLDAPIQVTFSQPMARDSAQVAFAIQPAPYGELTWLDDYTLRFQPVRLAHGVNYQIHVGGRSLRGMQLTGTKAWSFTTVPDAPIALSPGPSVIKMPILTYHYIRTVTDRADQLGFKLSVTPANFAAQMDWLAQNGYHPITMDDLGAYLAGTHGLPARPIVLTFDDGYADFYTNALPVLLAHDFKSVSYVVTGFIGRAGYMNGDQILTADRDGVEIASHTVDHVDLTSQSLAGLRYQLASSKEALERLLGHPVLSFCYPYGTSNSLVAAAVAAAGYRDATTTKWGIVQTQTNRYQWGRLRVSGGETLEQFAASVLTAS
jgi:peptidoglycan/xylan/chitin deacetylase (PgdA/CDA1 family)